MTQWCLLVSYHLFIYHISLIVRIIRLVYCVNACTFCQNKPHKEIQSGLYVYSSHNTHKKNCIPHVYHSIHIQIYISFIFFFFSECFFSGQFLVTIKKSAWDTTVHCHMSNFKKFLLSRVGHMVRNNLVRSNKQGF